MAKSSLGIGQELHGDNVIYRIESILGQGSFGITYKAKAFTVIKGKFGEELVETKTLKAIKEFFMKEVNGRDEFGSITGMSEGSLSYNYAQKFKKEAENLAGMNHPNIVKIIDFINANNTYYYVMDYIDGENLNDYLKHHKMSEQEAVDTILEVAKALQYMHEEKHMLHLDLKPGNIMRRNDDGHIFLIDFGLSKHYNEEGQPDTSTTIGLGTEGYAPLEQGKRATAQNAFRPTIDVYALGGTLFKLLTCETPPSASDILDDDELLEEIMRKHNVSQQIQKIIVEAMSPRAKFRMPSVAKFMDTLDNKRVEMKSIDAREDALHEKTTVVIDEDNLSDVNVTVVDIEPLSHEHIEVANPSVIDRFGVLDNVRKISVGMTSIKMILVEAGHFQMGATNEQKEYSFLDEKPAHLVFLRTYYIAEIPVTRTLWNEVMNNRSTFDDKDYPVTSVSWDDCNLFIDRLNEKTGRKFRLPSEAEWEFAARGGLKSKGTMYAGSDDINEVAWYAGNCKTVHFVKMKKPNELGLFDMSGNVKEWCQDWFDSYTSEYTENPICTTKSLFERVVRGGGYESMATMNRVSARFSSSPNRRSGSVGFRLVMDA